MRKVALLAAALGLGAGAFLPGSSGPSAQQIAQEAKALAERQPPVDRGRVMTSVEQSMRLVYGGYGQGAAGGYRKRPRGSHKQNRRVQMRLNAKRRARG